MNVMSTREEQKSAYSDVVRGTCITSAKIHEWKYSYLFSDIALNFVKHSLQNNLIAPGVLPEHALVALFAHYQTNHPSTVQISDIVDALRETSLIKKNHFKTGNNVIEFKDQIFTAPGGSKNSYVCKYVEYTVFSFLISSHFRSITLRQRCDKSENSSW